MIPKTFSRPLLFWAAASTLLLLCGCAAWSPFGSNTPAPAAAVSPTPKPTGTVAKPAVEAAPKDTGNAEKAVLPAPAASSAVAPVSAPVRTETASAQPAEPRRTATRSRPSSPVSFSAPPSPGDKDAGVTINFDNADLYEVIRTLAGILKINYVMDASIKGKVTIQTSRPLTRKQLFPVFFQILEINGLTALPEAGVYRIFPLKDAARMAVRFRGASDSSLLPAGERVVIQVIPLRFISAAEMVKIITPFVSPEGTIVSQDQTNTLVVVDKAYNIAKVLSLVSAFDIDVFARYHHRFFFLKNTDAEDLAKTLTDIVAAHGAEAQSGFKLIPIKRLNAILAISKTPQLLDIVQKYVAQLDVVSQEAEPRIYVYSVKNGQAQELADLLHQVFGKTSGKSETAKKPASTEPARSRPVTMTPTEIFPKPVAKKAPTQVSYGRAGETMGAGMLSGPLRVTADPVRNALIIEAVPRDYRIISEILQRLDVLPRQVLIEAVIAEITLDASSSLGVNWSYLPGTGTPSTSVLSATAGNTGIQYVIGQTARWTATLSALASEDKVDILSAPTVLASDNKKAVIDVTTEVPVASAQYTYDTGGTNPLLQTNIQYRNTGVILDVTPHINEHGLVSMDVSQEVSEQAASVQVGNTTMPSFFKRSVKTSLTVANDQTIVLGGLMKENASRGTSGVPFLKDLPLIGQLFQTANASRTKTDLIIMLTPRVITNLKDVDAITRDFRAKMAEIKTTPSALTSRTLPPVTKPERSGNH